MTLSHYPAKIQYLQDELFGEKEVQVGMLRLDELHPIVSGNKLFKLHYFIKRAVADRNQGIITFGGAYSNHLVATAFACQQMGLKSVGIVRGDQLPTLNHTLDSCNSFGMQLHFIPRSEYAEMNKRKNMEVTLLQFPGYLLVPEGGYHPDGAAGAALVMEHIPAAATHICCPVGTVTTVAGLLLGVRNTQQIIAFPVLKGMTDLEDRIKYLTTKISENFPLRVLDSYHFGGYAKKEAQLITFMNRFFEKYGIPTDVVYTGKMMFGVIDCISKDVFPRGSHIICLHTGGLQGNLSLPGGTLVF